ncbi:MAG: class I SAM-dependent methyltransferase [Actinobacteria bacterium]|nr:class I SAM-dependent methyltransferase [Actinomycetota bacterium]
MRKDLLGFITCPSCGADNLVLKLVAEDGREVREGSISCGKCKAEYQVRSGVTDLMHDPSPAVRQEREAWEAMRPVHRHDDAESADSRAWLRALPMLEGKEGPPAELETWRRHGRAVFELCAGEDWRGKRVLELGAGRCWLSAYLARKGAEVLAVDILEDADIGLGCAEAFLEEGIYFERVLCDMHHLPFKGGTCDGVVATATLHHSPEPLLLCEEIRRVIAPGGLLVAANEPLYVPWRETPEEERRGAHEGAYPLWTWLKFLRRTGFRVNEIRVGRDASLHVKASPHAARGLPRPIETLRAAAAYAAILAMALPRFMLRVTRSAKAGRPMLPLPRDLRGYLLTRAGLKGVGEEARAEEEGNWGPGWYPPEGDWEAFRWCGPRSRLLLPSPRRASTLVMELATFHPNPRSNPVQVVVMVGRDKVGEAMIDRHGWRDYRFDTHGGIGKSTIPVTLQVKRGFFVPREMGLGEDRRVLGVACRFVRWAT